MRFFSDIISSKNAHALKSTLVTPPQRNLATQERSKSKSKSTSPCWLAECGCRAETKLQRGRKRSSRIPNHLPPSHLAQLNSSEFIIAAFGNHRAKFLPYFFYSRSNFVVWTERVRLECGAECRNWPRAHLYVKMRERERQVVQQLSGGCVGLQRRRRGPHAQSIRCTW